MRTYLAVLTMLAALASGVGALPDVFPQKGWTEQPDGTILHYVQYGDKTFVDGYVVVYGSDGWWYYAELDVRGEYEASPYKVGIDDPAEIGIPRDLQRQRSGARQAEIDAASIMLLGTGRYLIQPDGTEFLAYWDHPLPIGCGKTEVPADGYVIAIRGVPLINYAHSSDDPERRTVFTDPFWAFVYDEESGWYYYAELDAQGEYPQGYVLDEQGYIRNAQGDYVASSYRVGIDDPPGYNLPTAVQERSWGAMKHLFRK